MTLQRSCVWLLVLLTVAACNPKPPDDRDYATRIAADRADKDALFMKEAEPIPENRKADLLPLLYFPIDPEYNVPATLTPSTDDSIIQIPTSTGALRPYRRAGTLKFSLKGESMQITAFVEPSDSNFLHLEVMFSDLTSGTETYPAGRYINLTRSPSGVYELDFNRAYNPYCYYNASYECPYPPAENRLKVPIRAGEKMKQSNK